MVVSREPGVCPILGKEKKLAGVLKMAEVKVPVKSAFLIHGHLFD